jgi:hypothetical protein
MYARGHAAARTGGGAWSAEANTDEELAVWGTMDTTTIINSIVAGVKQSFLTGAVITNTSGVLSTNYVAKNANTNALDEIERLLAIGHSTNVRMLARVVCPNPEVPSFALEVYKEPVSSETGDLYLYPDRIERAFGGKQRRVIDRREVPAAIWTRLADVVPLSADLGLLGSLDKLFIESTDYQVASDEMSTETRDVASPWTLGEITH